MKAQEAINLLVNNGKGTEVQALLERSAQNAANTYAGIRDDTSRSEEWKKDELKNRYEAVLSNVERELAGMASRVVVDDRDDAERVLGIAGLRGDVASLTISRRDASNRVAAITPAERRELLKRATRMGDEVLARAIAEKALDDRDDKTLHQFIADRPELDEATERLWKAGGKQRDTFMFGGLSMLALRPAELAGMTA